MSDHTPTIHPDDELLTTTQAARELGISRLTLVLRCYRGEIPFRQVPGRILLRRADIDRVKKILTTGSVSAAREATENDEPDQEAPHESE
jgi:excisionase family DNA binding protein